MDRRKFLASIVGLGTIAVIQPQLFINREKEKVQKKDIVSKFNIRDKNTVRDYVIGYIISINGKEVVIRPFDAIEEFPALKKGDHGIIFSSVFSERTDDPPCEEKNLLHHDIIVGEDIPAMGPGSDIILLLGEDEKYLFICKQFGFDPEQVKPKLYDNVLFPEKLQYNKI